MLLCIVGPTCSGKSTLERKLVSTGSFGKITSFTTRPKRKGEIQGEDYYFMDKLPDVDDIVESNFFNGNYYGVTLDELLDKTNRFDNVIVVVEPNGLIQFRKICAEYQIEVTALYLSHSIKTLTNRLFERFKLDEGSDSEVYSRRCVSMFSEWMTWPTATNYDLEFEDFGPDTEEELIQYLTGEGVCATN